MRRFRRSSAYALGVLGALVTALMPSTGAFAEGDVDPTNVPIPYEGTANVSPSQGWTFSDCGAVSAASDLVLSCEPSGITFGAETYDPEIDPVVVTAEMTNGRTTMTIDYRVSLEPPEPPATTDLTYAGPASAGTPVLIPFSDLGISCTLCSDGAGIDAASLSPADAGEFWATPTHLVFSPRPDFTGKAELTYRAGDSAGGWSQGAVVTVDVSPQAAQPVTALHVFATLGAEQTVLTLSDMVSAGSDVTFTSCGPPMHGVVTCSEEGEATYTPSGDAQVDQFSFHVVSESGAQATGSVTVVPEDSALPQKGLVPLSDGGTPFPLTSDEKGTRIALALPYVAAPADDTTGGDHFTAFRRFLDEVGA